MFEHFYNIDLPRQKLLQVFLRCIALRDNLHGDVRLVTIGVRQLYDGVRTFTNVFHDTVAMIFQYWVALVVSRTIAGRRASFADGVSFVWHEFVGPDSLHIAVLTFHAKRRTEECGSLKLWSTIVHSCRDCS